MTSGRLGNWTLHGSRRRRRRPLQTPGPDTHTAGLRLQLVRPEGGLSRGSRVPSGTCPRHRRHTAGTVAGPWPHRTGAAGGAGIHHPHRGTAEQRHRGHRRSHRTGAHKLAGLAKDIGSAAVLMSFVLLVVVWLIVLLGR